jgi:mRNA interferase MazF
MKRGDIYFAKLDPTIGEETQKNRPVLIVSNNANNNAASTITIIPITSNIKKYIHLKFYWRVKNRD